MSPLLDEKDYIVGNLESGQLEFRVDSCEISVTEERQQDQNEDEHQVISRTIDYLGKITVLGVRLSFSKYAKIYASKIIDDLNHKYGGIKATGNWLDWEVRQLKAAQMLLDSEL